MPFLSPTGEPLLNPYELLELEHGATDSEISKAFKKRMLHLHPDKQPPGQSPEEAITVERLMHDVMDARSFLLEGEHMATRRLYDSKLVLAKQQPPPVPVQQQTKVHHHVAGATTGGLVRSERSGKLGGTRATSTSKNRSETIAEELNRSTSTSNIGSGTIVEELNGDGGTTIYGEKPSTTMNNNLNVKRWGKIRKSASSLRRAANAKRKEYIDKETNNTSSRGKAFHDSCGDCSTTEENSTSDDELKQSHTYLNNTDATNECKKISSRTFATQMRVPKPSHSGRRNSFHDSRPANEQRSMSYSGMNLAVNAKSFRSSIPTNFESDLHHPKPASKRRQSEEDLVSKSKPVRRQSDSCILGASGGEMNFRQGGGEGRRSPDTHHHLHTSSRPTILLDKHYYCPLTKDIMKEPMSDAQGNTYERQAILKYLETHTMSPITGKSLSPMHLTPNTVLAEKIRLALKARLDSLQNAAKAHNKHQQPREVKYKSIRDAVDGFIHDLNSGLPSISISKLDSYGMTSFVYTGIKFRLDVPNTLANNVIIQTWFEHCKRTMEITTLVVKFNASLQKTGGGGRLTFRKMNGKYVFTFTKKVDLALFEKNSFRYGIEYFVEMSIKLHNIIHPADFRKLEKVKLTNSVAV